MNKTIKTLLILIALTLLAGCVTDPTSTEATSSAVSSSAIVASSSDSLTSSSSVIAQPVSSSIQGTSSSAVLASSTSGWTSNSYYTYQWSDGTVYTQVGGSFGTPLTTLCMSIDTALPHGLNPDIVNFITTMKASGVAPANYDSLVTSMSILRCHVSVRAIGMNVVLEITHEGNSASGLIALHKVINAEINGKFFSDVDTNTLGMVKDMHINYVNVLDSEMQAVIKQHQNNRVGVDGCVFPDQYPIIKQ